VKRWVALFAACSLHPPPEDPADRLAAVSERAEAAYRAGKLVVAARLYEALAEAIPGEPALEIRLGEIAARRHDDAAAEGFYGAAVTLDPDEAAPRYALASVYLNEGRLDDALDAFRAAEERGSDEDRVPSLRIRAALALARDRLQQARSLYLALRPDDEGACVGLGVIATRLGDTDEALAWFARAPRSAVSLYDRAIVEEQLGRHDAAIADGAAAIQLDPELLPAQTNLALALAAAGRAADAERLLAATVTLHPTYLPARGDLGALRLARGALDDAETDLRAVTAAAPGVAAYHFDLALVFLRGERWTDARAELVKTLELDPANDRARRDLRWLDGKRAGELTGDAPPVASIAPRAADLAF
jgi:tetratricopeptide (TPR) repeat protein